ncbi:holin family protein [Clostridium sp.]|jgi:toxin secretion/phage lysis holin|uniref:phage holin family protein n=1 Tax=Clostridium sp. TaxID=1506 RepID=UPI003A454F08
MNKHLFNTIVAGVGSMLTYLFGGWDTCLIVLVIFMALDYITGLVSAYLQCKLNSKIGYKGIAKKASILVVLVVAVLLDRLLNSGIWVFRTLVCYFYIANEGISILENCGKCGLPLPEKLTKALEQLKK